MNMINQNQSDQTVQTDQTAHPRHQIAIASVCFFPSTKNIGGAQVPSVAFKKWCDIFNLPCDVVAIKPIQQDQPDQPGQPDQTDQPDTMIPKYKTINRISDLQAHGYTHAFFSTPSHNMNYHIEISKLDIPYAVMVHSEYDCDFYNTHHNHRMFNNAAVNVVISPDLDYWNFPNQLFWYPCTLPEYLTSTHRAHRIHFMNDVNANKSGLLYLGRMSTMKNLSILADFTHINKFMEMVDGNVTVHGDYNKESHRKQIEEKNPKWNHRKEHYNIYDYVSMSNLCMKYKYFWDVYGDKGYVHKTSMNKSYQIKQKRFNLVGFEALHFGMLPIASIHSVPDYAAPFIVDVEKIMDSDKRHQYIDMILQEHNQRLENLYGAIISNNQDFHGVRSQVIDIIHKLTSTTSTSTSDIFLINK